MYKKNPLRTAVSDRELARRWEAARTLMREHSLDCLLTQGNNMHLGGYVRWFTDIAAEGNLFTTVLFPLDDEMTLVRSSLQPIPAWARRGIADVKYELFAPSLNYTTDVEVAAVIGYLKKKNVKRLGLVGKAVLNARLILAIKAQLPDVALIDITNELDLIKAIKSDEELSLIRETARIHDVAWAALPAVIKPGMREYQIRSEVIRLLAEIGSEEYLVFMGTAPPYKPCGMSTFQFANRVVNEGDYGTLLIEVSGSGGYYCESARNFSFGEPYPELQKAWDVAVEAQQLTADLTVPGRHAKEIVAVYNEYVSERGYSPEGRLYGHSQGYDLIERPAFMAKHRFGEEDMLILPGMNVSLHPYFIDDIQTVYINDNYFVTETGAEKIHQTPPEIIVL